jgi:hypothetical protein
MTERLRRAMGNLADIPLNWLADHLHGESPVRARWHHRQTAGQPS